MFYRLWSPRTLIIGNEELSTNPEKELDEFIKSSVEDLVLIPSESKDTSKSDSECILPSCDDFSSINVFKEKAVSFSNPLFNSNDDFTSSDDESLSNKDVLKENVKIYSNPLFEFDDEYISSDVNPLFDEVLEDIESKDSYDSNLDEPDLLVTHLSDVNEDEYFTPGDDVGLLLHRDSSTLIMSVVSILEGSEDTIFELGISAFHFSHWSGTFISFNVYPNILNESPMEICSSTRFNPIITMIWVKSHKSYAPTSKTLTHTRAHATTRHKGKEIAKPITPLSESASEEDSDPEQAQKDKKMLKNLALIAKYFKKIFKPTNNNLKTFSNTRNKNVDTTPRYKNDNQTGQFRNQRTVIVVVARETVGGQVVQKTRIQCFNCKEFGHFAKECKKPKRVKNSVYHKKKMLLCKQAKKVVPLQAEQSDWPTNTDDEINEQELEAHYSYMAKIHEVPTADSRTDPEPLEHVQYDVGYNVFANEIYHSKKPEFIKCDDERVALANLIANLKRVVDENKKMQKELKKANASLTQELTKFKSILAKTSRTLGESNSIRDSCLVALQNKQTEFERYKAFNDRIVDYDKLKCKLNETLRLLAQKDIDLKEGLKLKTYKIVIKEKHDELFKEGPLTKSHYEGLVKEKTKESINPNHSYDGTQRPTTIANPMYLKKAQSEKTCLYAIPNDQSDPANKLVPDREDTLTLERESRSKLNKDLVRPYIYKTK
nr:hypothetical protein [Tanacetum cinerariifolium]